MQTMRRHWGIVVAILILGGVIGVVMVVSLKQNEGHLVYALDDAYIHIAIAKNLSQYGVWGITKDHFSSSSSSLAWPLLLALLYRLFGVQELIPLILNIVFAVLMLCAVYWFLGENVPQYAVGLIVLGLAFLTPLFTLIFTGMEHILQVFGTLIIVFLASKTLLCEGSERNPVSKVFFGLIPFVTLIRYEGLFLLFVLWGLFLVRKRFLEASLLAVLGLIPVISYGIISSRQGWYFLPNSLLLKSTLLSPSRNYLDFCLTGYRQLYQNPHLLWLLVLAIGLFIIRYEKRTGLWSQYHLMAIMFIATTLLHVQFAGTGWFYRYDAYLVALGVFVVAPELFAYLAEKCRNRRRLADYFMLFLVLLTLFFLGKRGCKALIQTPQAMHDRYLEHVYPAWFVARYYNDARIVINDVGTVSFYTHAQVFDLYGLGNIEPIRFRMQPDGYTKADVAAWIKAQNAQIAILQIGWQEIRKRIPDEWIKIAEWEIPRNVVFQDTTVGIYALQADEQLTLVRNLTQFATSLPKSIRLTIFPVKP